jgi:hypothetical protein
MKSSKGSETAGIRENSHEDITIANCHQETPGKGECFEGRGGKAMKPAATPLTPEQLEALRRLDACTVANAIETFQKRLRNEGFVDQSIRSIFPRLQPMVGFAARGQCHPYYPRGEYRRVSRNPDGSGNCG